MDSLNLVLLMVAPALAVVVLAVIFQKRIARTLAQFTPQLLAQMRVALVLLIITWFVGRIAVMIFNHR